MNRVQAFKTNKQKTNLGWRVRSALKRTYSSYTRPHKVVPAVSGDPMKATYWQALLTHSTHTGIQIKHSHIEKNIFKEKPSLGTMKHICCFCYSTHWSRRSTWIQEFEANLCSIQGLWLKKRKREHWMAYIFILTAPLCANSAGGISVL